MLWRPSQVLALLLSLLGGTLGAQDSTKLRPLVGARFGSPLDLAFYIGAVRTGMPRSPHGDYRGPAIVLEPGLGGGQLSVGFAAGSGFGGTRAQLSLLRTWGEPGRVAAHQTFLGAELRLTFIVIGFGVGAFVRVAGNALGDDHFVSFSYVAGF